MNKVLVLFFCLLSIMASAKEQFNKKHNNVSDTIKENDPYFSQWQRIENFLENSKPKSAVSILDSIYTIAKAHNESIMMLKAQFYYLRIIHDTSENNELDLINYAEKNAKEDKFPNNAVWQSIAAQLYWNYYQRHKYTILNNSKINKDVKIEEIEQWDAKRFFDKSASLYMRSIARSEELKGYNCSQFNPVLIEGENTALLRPTLFDLLVYRAIDFYNNDEKDLINPLKKFELADSFAFATKNKFLEHKFETNDLTNLQWLALQWYKQLLKFHETDTTEDALIDADLHRLDFAYTHCVLTNKKNLYMDGLRNIEFRYSLNALSAMASYKIALLMCNIEEPESILNSQNNITPNYIKLNYSAIVQKLKNIIINYPNSEGATKAITLLYYIEKQSLSYETEQIILPNEASKIVVTYRNTPKIWVRVIQIPNNLYAQKKGNYNLEKWWQTQLTKTPIYNFDVSLPSYNDYYGHTTEIKIDSLPIGTYGILISNNRDFIGDSANIVACDFLQVSNLCVVSNSGSKDNFILNRKSGEPVKKVRVTKYFDNKKAKGKREKVFTKEDGSFSFKNSHDANYFYGNIIATKNKDTVLESFNTYNSSIEKSETETTTFFFTDRAIYRPGQTVFFKGIIVKHNDNGKILKVAAGLKTAITFDDVNENQIDSLELITNDFGSFTGKFVIPENVLTGNFEIANETGHTTIKVEEYKRPKFSIEFLPVKDEIRVFENVSIKGVVTSYSGSFMDEAKVKYSITRNGNNHSYWKKNDEMPDWSSEEIGMGELLTNKAGKFTIAFKATPDKNVSKKINPVFSYTIKVDVTDKSGETHHAEQSVNAGYTTLVLDDAIEDKGTTDKFDSLNMVTTNTNGEFVSSKVNIQIFHLKSAEKIYRKRLWEKPEFYLMDSTEFRIYFPNDEYKDENNYKNWDKELLVLDTFFITNNSSLLHVKPETWKYNGYYIIEMNTKDKYGTPIYHKKYVEVWDTKNSNNIIDPLLVIPYKNYLIPGDLAECDVVSGFEKGNILQYEQLMYDNTTKTWLEIENNKRVSWSKNIEETDRGGIMVSYFMLKNNRFYYENIKFEIPWYNKKLDLKWETHRDKLQPGEKEKWTLNIKGEKDNKETKELLVSMYDGSLDAIKLHWWGANYNYEYLLNENNSKFSFSTDISSTKSAYLLGKSNNFINSEFHKNYSKFLVENYNIGTVNNLTYGWNYKIEYEYDSVSSGIINIGGARTNTSKLYVFDGVAVQNVKMTPMAIATMPTTVLYDIVAKPEERLQSVTIKNKAKQNEENSILSKINIRKNLSETAFFYPQLRTDDSGNVKFEFTMPEALTEWKLMAFGHTKDWATGLLYGKIKTQKNIMVMPHLPRFLRQGDTIAINSAISNLTDSTLFGTTELQIINTKNNANITTLFLGNNTTKQFEVNPMQSTNAQWKLYIPENIEEPVIIRIAASAGNFTDGEENTLPTLSNKTLVTETVPVYVNGNNAKSYQLPNLLNSDNSKSLRNYGLTLEYTSNPAWYAVQALPYLMEFPHECAEQTFNRFYANALANNITHLSPKIEAIFHKWETEDTVTLLSNLNKNEELKTAIIAETPWLMDAKNETEQKHRIASLFETSKLKNSLNTTLNKLKEMQNETGGFAWFKGMDDDRYITQYITTGIGKLQHFGITNLDNLNSISKNSLAFLDLELNKNFKELLKNKIDTSTQQIGNEDVQYLYTRSFYNNEKIIPNNLPAYNYFLQQAKHYRHSFNKYMQGMIALTLFRNGDTLTAKDILDGLKQTAHRNDEMGMYWNQPGESYWWYDAPIEMNSLMIECFNEINRDTETVNALKINLLKNKQTNCWQTTRATADACYALLLNGSDWLSKEPEVNITLGNEITNSTSIKKEDGSGYYKINYKATDIKPEMGNIKITVKNNEQSTSWGAVYWQYFENYDKIKAANTPLIIKKQLFRNRNTMKGVELDPITDSSILNVGDKITIRIDVSAARNMEYIHLKDVRASCFEPINVFSGYLWQDGMGYYQTTKDASSNFFINKLKKGKYTFEYSVYVAQSGDFSNGIATIQCMYAPEFSSHTAGNRIKVKEK